MEKLLKMWGALIALLMMPVETRDEKQLRAKIAEYQAFLDSDEAKSLHTIGQVRAELDQLKKDLAAQTEALRKAQKLGLGLQGNGVILPRGRAERKEMLADNRAFMSDETAKRFGALMCDITFKMANQYDKCPTFIKEIAAAVRKDDVDLDPASATLGGALIPEEFLAEIIRNVEAEGVVFTKARRVPLTTVGTTHIPKRTGGPTALWIGAGTQITRTAPTSTLISLTPEKLAVIIGVPNEFTRSTVLVALGQYLGVELTWAISYALDDAIVNGDGTSTYGGIDGIMHSANIAPITAVTAAHDLMTEIDVADVSAVINGLTVQYAAEEAMWCMSRSVLGALRALRASATSIPLYQRGSNGEPNTIDDYPYFISPRMPAAGAITASTKWGFFGNLRLSHVVGMIGNIEIARSTDAAFEADMTLIRAIVHCDIQEADVTAVVTGKTAAGS